MALSSANFELVCCCPVVAAFAEGRHPGRQDRRKIFGHFGPVEQQGREALLVNLVDHDVAHCPQCRRLADAGEQTRLSEEVAGSEAADLLRMGVIVAALLGQ